ncbi:MAG: radical SAM protein [Deltaproteobacteria bacterium SG8_13]|nr:MAG: radical SAM protein [Deltaproteobacteria bacterium SG8_13]
MEAFLYESLEQNKVRCRLCHHRCVIKDNRRGICGVRENKGGSLQTQVFGKLIARNIDPIEKKPLYHFLPGTLSYSIATVGCNFKCRFCQNADIAQMPADRRGMILGDPATPEEVVEAAQRSSCRSISYTYTEPTVFFEFAYETAKRASAAGIRNVFVTNGYMTPEAVEMIQPYLDAANVDLKAFDERYYKDLCGAKLEPVKNTLRLMRSLGIFLEVTTLLVPGLNDSRQELEQLAEFLVNDLGPETPWHISRFHPTYRLTDRPPTPVDTLLTARQIGLKAGLRYVYTGNVPGQDSENTFCYRCGKMLVERQGFQIRGYKIESGCCRYCHAPIDGVGL